jgi:hypothetical protein
LAGAKKSLGDPPGGPSKWVSLMCINEMYLTLDLVSI